MTVYLGISQPPQNSYKTQNINIVLYLKCSYVSFTYLQNSNIVATSDWKRLQTAHLVQTCSCMSFVFISVTSMTVAINLEVIKNTKLLPYSFGDQKTYLGLLDYNQGGGRPCVSLGEGMTFILQIVSGIQVLIVVGLRAPCPSWLWAEGHFKPHVNGK